MTSKLFVAKVFVLAVLVWYMPGFMLSLIYSEYFSHYYSPFEFHYLILCLFLMLFFFVFYFFLALSGLLPKIKTPVLGKLFFKITYSFLAVVFLFLSAFFFVKYSSGFRHSNRLSDASPLVSALWVVKPFVMVVVLQIYLTLLQYGEINKLAKGLLLFFSVGFTLSVTSSIQATIPLLLLIMFFFPRAFDKPFISLSIRRKLIIIFFSFSAVSLALFMGIGSKVGHEKFFENGLSSVADVLIDYFPSLIPRLSTSFVSLMYWLDHWIAGPGISFQFVDSVSSTVVNRVCAIANSSCFDPTIIDTVNRYNHLTVMANHAARAGASPGILASVFYFPYPFGFFYIPFFLVLLVNVVAQHIKVVDKKRITYYAVIPFLLFSLLEAPLNVFYFLDPSLFLFLFFLLSFQAIDLRKVFHC